MDLSVEIETMQSSTKAKCYIFTTDEWRWRQVKLINNRHKFIQTHVYEEIQYFLCWHFYWKSWQFFFNKKMFSNHLNWYFWLHNKCQTIYSVTVTLNPFMLRCWWIHSTKAQFANVLNQSSSVNLHIAWINIFFNQTHFLYIFTVCTYAFLESRTFSCCCLLSIPKI